MSRFRVVNHVELRVLRLSTDLSYIGEMRKPEPVDVYFRKKVRSERERRRWSQLELAKKLSDLGVAMYGTTIAKIESGERAVRVDEAAGIADVLELPLDWMLGRPKTGPANEIRYSLRVLREKAQDTISDIGSMIEALQDWETDTYAIDFDGKDELGADLNEAARALNYVQALLVQIAVCDLPDDHPAWQIDLDQLHEALQKIVESFHTSPLKKVEGTTDDA